MKRFIMTEVAPALAILAVFAVVLGSIIVADIVLSNNEYKPQYEAERYTLTAQIMFDTTGVGATAHSTEIGMVTSEEGGIARSYARTHWGVRIFKLGRIICDEQELPTTSILALSGKGYRLWFRRNTCGWNVELQLGG